MSFGRTQQLHELQQIIQEISKEIMWVNDKEEQELMFDWGDKNIEQYIPRKQESYSVSQINKSSVRVRFILTTFCTKKEVSHRELHSRRLTLLLFMQ